LTVVLPEVSASVAAACAQPRGMYSRSPGCSSTRVTPGSPLQYMQWCIRAKPMVCYGTVLTLCIKRMPVGLGRHPMEQWMPFRHHHNLVLAMSLLASPYTVKPTSLILSGDTHSFSSGTVRSFSR
jgi:hypothetical protein